MTGTTQRFNAESLYDAIQRAAIVLREKSSVVPSVGIILGTGLGSLVERVTIDQSIDYADIPGFPLSTVESHEGRLILGFLESKPVVIMQGRFHVYEGYSQQEITFPVRVMNRLGARTLIVSNACGCLNPLYRRGEVMIIDDHINLLGSSPLVGPNDERLGPRFPDMSAPYSPKLIALALQAALSMQRNVHRGVYVAVPGPNLETRAEYRYLRTIGADVVGMSTIPETIVARHMGMDVLGVSVITDECFPDALKEVSLAEILSAAATAEPLMTSIIQYVLRSV